VLPSAMFELAHPTVCGIGKQVIPTQFRRLSPDGIPRQQTRAPPAHRLPSSGSFPDPLRKVRFILAFRGGEHRRSFRTSKTFHHGGVVFPGAVSHLAAPASDSCNSILSPQTLMVPTSACPDSKSPLHNL
jgi:hypothetical protein